MFNKFKEEMNNELKLSMKIQNMNEHFFKELENMRKKVSRDR